PPPAAQYIRRHVNLFSVPHTVTEDLARQPTVTVKKITPASVREFLRRSQGSSHGDLSRALLEFCLSDCNPPAALDECKAIWAQLRGVPLLPLANGTAGTFPKTFFLGGKQSFVLGTRRQQGLLPQLKGRFVHLNATRRLAKFFERDEFLEVGARGRDRRFVSLAFDTSLHQE
ncbi:unnamed protein product, partial [Hapterophycus canaliculatus]